ncbi:hypothetical protein [Deinococcus multiflagellatus]|uniref:hypothetical protein n=1 Tax=Deinococcus multiflagellatus TaxID=1656887 RepID=UPI001CCED31B|nr:hypothetical protein [Deinococcus multiflagellatus]MBZ9715118.1 hypothetical protein [Deinococcus multiflagellatus]
MLRAAFWLTALLFVPLGLYLYFLPPAVASLIGVSPLWLARGAGAVVLAWGAFQLAASFAPDRVKVGGLVGGNLLLVAALLPPVLRGADTLAAPLRTALLVVSGALALLAVMALLGSPSRRSRL